MNNRHGCDLQIDWTYSPALPLENPAQFSKLFGAGRVERNYVHVFQQIGDARQNLWRASRHLSSGKELAQRDRGDVEPTRMLHKAVRKPCGPADMRGADIGVQQETHSSAARNLAAFRSRSI